MDVGSSVALACKRVSKCENFVPCFVIAKCCLYRFDVCKYFIVLSQCDFARVVRNWSIDDAAKYSRLIQVHVSQAMIRVRAFMCAEVTNP